MKMHLYRPTVCDVGPASIQHHVLFCYQDSMLTFGGAVMAAYSVEHVNLHYRVALGVLNRISFRPEWWVKHTLRPLYW